MSDAPGDAKSWFYVREGRRQGPFDRRRLVEALLALDAPEAALVWHTGRASWTQAGDVEELRQELPPPVPPEAGGEPPRADTDRLRFAPPPPLPSDPEDAPPDHGLPETGSDPLLSPDPEGSGPPDAPLGGLPSLPDSDAKRHRRRRKHKHEPNPIGPYVFPLLVVLAILALVLWFLLRRMNEVPPGRIMMQGTGAPAATVPSLRFG
jgi:hypothetical protein